MQHVHLSGQVVYRWPIGNLGVPFAEVTLWDTDVALVAGSADDSIGTITTDERGFFAFDFDFDSAHGYDPGSVSTPFGTVVGMDAFRPYVRVRLGGVQETGPTGPVNHDVTYNELRVGDVLPPPQLVVVKWSQPQVALPQDVDLYDRAVRAANVVRDGVAYQWLDLSSVPGAPDIEFNPPIPLLAPILEGGERIFDATLPPLEVTPLLTPPPGELTGPSYIDEREALGARLLDDDHAAQDSDFSQLSTLKGIFHSEGKPDSVDRISPDGGQPDEWFALQRLTGINPLLIARLGSKLATIPPADFALDAARVHRLTRSTWERLIDEQRLYVCDYTLLADTAQKYPVEGRFLPAPYAMFYRTRDAPTGSDPAGGPHDGFPSHLPFPRAAVPELMPLAIQPHPGAALAMPGDGAAWELAKMMVQVADVNLHELVYHLWGCHFSMEVFAVAAARNLSMWHPLRELLRRHTLGLIFINNYGLHHLINIGTDPRSPIRDFLAASFSGSMDIMSRGRARWSIAKQALPFDLVQRGLDDPETSLRYYPYRDDGHLVWTAIEQFIGAYIDVYYDAPHDVADDYELKNFFRELEAKQVPDVGWPSNLDPAQDLAQLKENLVRILWISTAVHNVLNAPQWPIAAFAANAPSASNLNPAEPASALPSAVYLANGQPHDNSKQRAIGMMRLMGELSLYNPDFAAGGLGHYRWWGAWQDERVKPIVDNFRSALAAAEAQIVHADQARPSYPWLRPSLINNSTST